MPPVTMVTGEDLLMGPGEGDGVLVDNTQRPEDWEAHQQIQQPQDDVGWV